MISMVLWCRTSQYFEDFEELIHDSDRIWNFFPHDMTKSAFRPLSHSFSLHFSVNRGSYLFCRPIVPYSRFLTPMMSMISRFIVGNRHGPTFPFWGHRAAVFLFSSPKNSMMSSDINFTDYKSTKCKFSRKRIQFFNECSCSCYCKLFIGLLIYSD